MYLGKVVGRLWATVKNANMQGQRLLIVQPLSPELKPSGKRLVCADWTGAGAGELVYWCRGRESSFAFLPDEVTTDTTIVAIVDSVRVERRGGAPAPGGPENGARLHPGKRRE